MTATNSLSAIEEAGRLQAELIGARCEIRRLTQELQQARRDYQTANDRIVHLLAQRTGERVDISQRRLREIEALRAEGFHVQKITKHQWKVGSLHLFVASGKWANAATGGRGRLRGWKIRELVDEQLSQQQAQPEARKGASA